jgi:hypothetical protein
MGQVLSRVWWVGPRWFMRPVDPPVEAGAEGPGVERYFVYNLFVKQARFNTFEWIYFLCHLRRAFVGLEGRGWRLYRAQGSNLPKGGERAVGFTSSGCSMVSAPRAEIWHQGL